MNSDGGLYRAYGVLSHIYSNGGVYRPHRVLRFIYSGGGQYRAYRVLRLMYSDRGLYRACRVSRLMYSDCLVRIFVTHLFCLHVCRMHSLSNSKLQHAGSKLPFFNWLPSWQQQQQILFVYICKFPSEWFRRENTDCGHRPLLSERQIVISID